MKGKDTPAAPTSTPKPRCVSCRRFLKTAERAKICPGCDKLYCDPCAAFGTRNAVGFLCCSNEAVCKNPPRCADCAFGKTITVIGKENKARRKRGEPVNTDKRENKKEGVYYPMSFCGSCNEVFCFQCQTFSTEGTEGHYNCVLCGKNRCFACCVESGDSKHFIMHCWGCEMSKCSECDPNKTVDVSVGEYYCGDCSENTDFSRGKKLMSATEFNDFCSKNGDKKIMDL